MKVKDPTGHTWRVMRRWVPWRRRLTGRMDVAWDLIPDGLVDHSIIATIFTVCLILIAPFLLLALVAGVEFLLLLLVLPLAVLLRAMRGRWVVEARRGFTIVWDAPAGGWRSSRARIAEVAAGISRGDLPDAAHVTGSAAIPTSHPETHDERRRP